MSRRRAHDDDDYNGEFSIIKISNLHMFFTLENRISQFHCRTTSKASAYVNI